MGKCSQPTHVYHGDGAGKQEGEVGSGREMQEGPGEWMEAFGKHGLKISQEKTEVMWVRQQGK